jgi:pimeloyl-ACP methyl ester carboxylesterase
MDGKTFSYYTAGIMFTVSASSMLPHPAMAAKLLFRVTIEEGLLESPRSGRLFIMLSRKKSPAPRMGPNWFRPEPFLRADVTDFAPGEARVIDAGADAFLVDLSDVPDGPLYAQAVLACAEDQPGLGTAPGNLFGPVKRIDVPANFEGTLTVPLLLDQEVPDPTLKASPVRHRLVEYPSPLLSEFHQRPVHHRARVILPEGYHDQPERRYPVIYMIPGFNGNHLTPYWRRLVADTPSRHESDSLEPVRFIRVMLDSRCGWGHHVFADSETNGPRGRALVEEMIPYIERHYRTIDEPTARFLTGHSSGGWASLWLQIRYPEVFGGTWSCAPDPVDFRDFQQIDLYAEENMFFTAEGRRRPLARKGPIPVIWYDTFSRMDDVVGRGGQLRSFEAVFSPLDEDGLPKKLWDRQTGRIDHQVAEAWKEYDINLVLRKNWRQLEPKLRGKLHIDCGLADTYYLDGAVELLAETLDELGSDAEVNLLPGEDHSSILTEARARRIRREMAKTFLRHHEWGTENEPFDESREKVLDLP